MATMALTFKVTLFLASITVFSVIYLCIVQMWHKELPVQRKPYVTNSTANRNLQVTSDKQHQNMAQSQNSTLRKSDQIVEMYEQLRKDMQNKILEFEKIHLNINSSVSEFQVLAKLIGNMLFDFKNSSLLLKEESRKPEMPSSLLTLFTTWKDDPNHRVIHNATLTNWASLKPLVKPVLFSSDPKLLQESLQFGWEWRNMTKLALNGLPVLKYMFMDAIQNYDSLFYGFANSDILFTGSLLKTLTSLQYSDVLQTANHFLVTGVRTNLGDFSAADISNRSSILRTATKKGSLFISSAADYFITDKTFPWNEIPEVVIGIIAYDNWLISHSRDLSFATIDATETVLAVHPTTTKDNFASHSKTNATYNMNLLAKTYGYVNYFRGYTDCMQYFTRINKERFVLERRTTFAFYC